MDALELGQRLVVALALGFLIGFERGWHEREAREGTRVAGIRTFAITGLLGGLWALLSEDLGDIVLAAAFVAYAAVLITAHFRAVTETGDHGVTTIVAAMTTFALGAVAVRGDIEVAAAGAVVTALLLGIKPPLHRWLTRIHRDELMAVLKLLAMTLVLLPVLPDRGYGPWQALNPYEIWLMVVLIAAISFVGYAAVRIAGKTRGLILAGAAGGLVSSTAVTVAFAQMARRSPGNETLLAAGILVAAATMFPRTLLIAWLIAPDMGPVLALPMVLAAVAAYGAAYLLWRRQTAAPSAPELNLRNPFEFMTALQFGLLLAVIMVLSQALQAWLGDEGLYLLAALSGASDVDAVNLAYSRLVADGGLAPVVAAAGVLIAAAANMVVKGTLAAVKGKQALAVRVGIGLATSTAAGAIGLALTIAYMDAWTP
jgi:uncharacterized membrane protein (DUF4010 family)